MATSRPNLDQAPPLPPSLQPTPQASLQGLAGPEQQADSSGSASLQKSVIERLMFVEKTLQDVSDIMPAAAPVVDSLISTMRTGMGKLLAKGAQPPPATGGGPGSLITGPPVMTGPAGA